MEIIMCTVNEFIIR